MNAVERPIFQKPAVTLPPSDTVPGDVSTLEKVVAFRPCSCICPENAAGLSGLLPFWTLQVREPRLIYGRSIFVRSLHQSVTAEDAACTASPRSNAETTTLLFCSVCESRQQALAAWDRGMPVAGLVPPAPLPSPPAPHAIQATVHFPWTQSPGTLQSMA